MPLKADRTNFDADMIIVNAKVITIDPAFSVARGVAVKDAKIIGVGDEADIRSFAGPATQVLDAGGKTVIPGLIDTHAHVEAAGLLKYTVSFDGVGSVAEALARVADMTARTPVGEWIRGRMWHPIAQLAEKRVPQPIRTRHRGSEPPRMPAGWTLHADEQPRPETGRYRPQHAEPRRRRDSS